MEVSSQPHSLSIVRASPCAQTPVHVHTQLPLCFVLSTSCETKTGCTCNQSRCQLASRSSWHHLLCVSRCRVNVRCEQNVYLCRFSSGSAAHSAQCCIDRAIRGHTHFFFVLFFKLVIFKPNSITACMLSVAWFKLKLKTQSNTLLDY